MVNWQVMVDDRPFRDLRAAVIERALDDLKCKGSIAQRRQCGRGMKCKECKQSAREFLLESCWVRDFFDDKGIDMPLEEIWRHSNYSKSVTAKSGNTTAGLINISFQ